MITEYAQGVLTGLEISIWQSQKEDAADYAAAMNYRPFWKTAEMNRKMQAVNQRCTAHNSALTRDRLFSLIDAKASMLRHPESCDWQLVEA